MCQCCQVAKKTAAILQSLLFSQVSGVLAGPDGWRNCAYCMHSKFPSSVMEGEKYTDAA